MLCHIRIYCGYVVADDDDIVVDDDDGIMVRASV